MTAIMTVSSSSFSSEGGGSDDSTSPTNSPKTTTTTTTTTTTKKTVKTMRSMKSLWILPVLFCAFISLFFLTNRLLMNYDAETKYNKILLETQEENYQLKSRILQLERMLQNNHNETISGGSTTATKHSHLIIARLQERIENLTTALGADQDQDQDLPVERRKKEEIAKQEPPKQKLTPAEAFKEGQRTIKQQQQQTIVKQEKEEQQTTNRKETKEKKEQQPQPKPKQDLPQLQTQLLREWRKFERYWSRSTPNNNHERDFSSYLYNASYHQPIPKSQQLPVQKFPDYIRGTYDADDDDVILATHTSISPTNLDRIDILQRFWQGPISLAVRIRSAVEIHQFFVYFNNNNKLPPPIRNTWTIHFLFEYVPPPPPKPVTQKKEEKQQPVAQQKQEKQQEKQLQREKQQKPDLKEKKKAVTQSLPVPSSKNTTTTTNNNNNNKRRTTSSHPRRRLLASSTRRKDLEAGLRLPPAYNNNNHNINKHNNNSSSNNNNNKKNQRGYPKKDDDDKAPVVIERERERGQGRFQFVPSNLSMKKKNDPRNNNHPTKDLVQDGSEKPVHVRPSSSSRHIYATRTRTGTAKPTTATKTTNNNKNMPPKKPPLNHTHYEDHALAYCQNILRNMALHSPTIPNFVLVNDLDDVPTFGGYPKLKRLLQEQSFLQDKLKTQKKLLVLPLLEILHIPNSWNLNATTLVQALNVSSISTIRNNNNNNNNNKNEDTDSRAKLIQKAELVKKLKKLTIYEKGVESDLPKSREELQILFQYGLAREWHYPPGHAPDNLRRFWSSTKATTTSTRTTTTRRPTTLRSSSSTNLPTYFIRPTPLYEPYFIGYKPQLPKYWEGFRGFGRNKESFVRECLLAGFQFEGLFDLYLTHLAHPSRNNMQQLQINAKEWSNRFEPYLRQKYNNTKPRTLYGSKETWFKNPGGN